MKILDQTLASETPPRRSLLIVDDSEFIRGRLLNIVNEIEYKGKIYSAKDSFQAYELFLSCSPDIVILDIHIPGDNGIRVLERLKKLRPSVQIVMLTNYPYDQYRKKCMDLGADFFFDKNREIEQLTETLEIMFDNHHEQSF